MFSASTRVLAYELGKYGVIVNAIAPGTTATERVIAVRSEEQRQMIGKSTHMGRIAEVEDMVGWVPRILYRQKLFYVVAFHRFSFSLRDYHSS